MHLGDHFGLSTLLYHAIGVDPFDSKSQVICANSEPLLTCWWVARVYSAFTRGKCLLKVPLDHTRVVKVVEKERLHATPFLQI